LAFRAVTARSSIAFASAAVPDCPPLANWVKETVNAIAVNAQMVLFM
jgi:hypothetical protein